MSRLRVIGNVAWWEFRRCWRTKDVIITVALSVALAFLWLAVQKVLAMSASDDTARLVLLAADPASLAPALGPDIELVPDEGRDESALRAEVDAGTIDGVLRVEDDTSGWIYVAESAAWVDGLRAVLDDHGRAARLRAAALTADAFEQLSGGFDLDVRRATPDSTVSSLAEKVAAGLFVGLMLFCLFVGNSYLFMFITGEKQQRVTEQVVSIISPQAWIDGKIAGLSLVALASMVSMMVAMAIWNGTLMVLGGGYDLTFGVIRPGLVLQFALLASLGFLLWFAFFGAIAATIDDPNTSSRSLFMFVPVIALSVAGACLKDPDTALMRFCGILPLTAPSVLPARLVLTNVAWWETPLAIALLIVSIWIMRRVAGKIFSMGILMHGKEPRWRDMVRALWSA